MSIREGCKCERCGLYAVNVRAAPDVMIHKLIAYLCDRCWFLTPPKTDLGP